MTTDMIDLKKEELIADYLLKNPSFFERQKSLLSKVKLCHDSGPAISLVERQVDVLRKEHRDLQTKFIDVLKIANHNEILLAKVHKLTISLLQHSSLQQFLSCLKQELCHQFDIDEVLIYFNRQFFSTETAWGAEVKAPADLAIFDDLNSGSAFPYCGELSSQQKNLLNSRQSQAIKSMALLQLKEDELYGYIILGSEKTLTFQESHGTLFLELLQSTVTHLIKYQFVHIDD